VHLHLERVPGRRRRALAPEGVDQDVARDDLVRVQEQVREQPYLPAGTGRDRLAALDDLDRSENPELRRSPLLSGRFARPVQIVSARLDALNRRG
jgi:hypothetical protein